MEKLNAVEINNAKYSTDEKVNNVSLWLSENAKNIKAGNHGYAAKCYFKAILGMEYK